MSATHQASKTFRSSNSEANAKRTSDVLFVEPEHLRYNNRSGRTLAATRANLKTQLRSVRLNTISSPSSLHQVVAANVAAMPWLPPLSGKKVGIVYIKQSEFKPKLCCLRNLSCVCLKKRFSLVRCWYCVFRCAQS